MDPTPPRVLFTGRIINYKIDVRIGFGQYVEVDTMEHFRNDATKPRTYPAISLDPMGNLQGSVRFFVLLNSVIIVPGTEGTKKEKNSFAFVSRDRWVKMKMNQDIIDRMNIISYNSQEEYPPVELADIEVTPERRVEMDMQEANKEVRERATAQVGEGHVPVETLPDVLPVHDLVEISPIPQNEVVQPISNEELPIIDVITPASTLVDELIRAESETIGDTGDITRDILLSEEIVNIPEEQPVVVEQPVKRTSSRATRGKPALKYSDEFRNLVAFRIGFSRGLKKYGVSAVEAAVKELKQMIKQGVWSKVRKKDLKKLDWSKIINCFMLLKEKFKPDGSFDKLKMRLAGGGDKQDRLD